MCGIFGYIGNRDAQPILLEGLRRLEYRGYEGAGIATIENGSLNIRKSPGKVSELEQLLEQSPVGGTIGIAHNRWPTHGGISIENTHPHVSMNGKIALVHNGVIRNHAELRTELQAEGVEFVSETDTETLVQFIAWFFDRIDVHGALAGMMISVVETVSRVEGSYAIAVMNSHLAEDVIAFARNGNELVIGINESGESFVASDVEALRGFANQFIRIKDGEIGAVIRGGKIRICGLSDEAIAARIEQLPPGKPSFDKAGYPHFMLKEIMEQPEALESSVHPSPKDEPAPWPSDDLLESVVFQRRTSILACGTSLHAAMVGERLLEDWAQMPVKVICASEWEPAHAANLNAGGVMLGISQSGETADTLSALRQAKEVFAVRVIGLTNRRDSALWQLADAPIDLMAGPEYAVASTKAFTAQVMTLAQLAIHLAEIRIQKSRHGIVLDTYQLLNNLLAVPKLIRSAIEFAETSTHALAQRYTESQRWIVIGRGYGVPLALEAGLKLKEVAYVDAHAFPAGELKHGTLALVEPGTPVVAIVPQNHLRAKMLSNMSEVAARGGHIIALTRADDAEVLALGKNVTILPVPQGPEELSPIFMAPALQLLAYHLSVCRGINPDQPRNLAKSVTVE